jgi:S1-C subfamily serine protease
MITASAIALGVLACGGSSDSTSTTSTTTPPTTTSVSSTTTQSSTPDATVFLGATLTAATAGEPGVVVRSIEPDSLSRLHRGDVIIAVNGEPVATPEELIDAAGGLDIGGKFRIRVVRGSHRFTLEEVQAATAYMGAEIKDATGSIKGAEVVSIAPDGPAAATELKPGDVIVALDDTRVSSSDGLLQAIGTHVPGDTVTLAVARGSDTRQITVTLARRPGTNPGN